MCELTKLKDITDGKLYYPKLAEQLLSSKFDWVYTSSSPSYSCRCYLNVIAHNLTGIHVNRFRTQWHLEVTGLSWRLSMLTGAGEVFPLRVIVLAVSLPCATLYRAVYLCRQDWARVQEDSRLWRLSAATLLDGMQMYVNEEVQAWHLHTGGMDCALPCRRPGTVGTPANTHA